MVTGFSSVAFLVVTRRLQEHFMVAFRGFSSCGSQALERGLSCRGERL